MTEVFVDLFALDELPDGQDWRELAACATADPELFFPFRYERAKRVAAKRVCDRCPVKGDCLQFAIDNGEEGIWGGMDDDQRRALRTLSLPAVGDEHGEVA